MKLAVNGLVFVEIAELVHVPFKHLVTALDEDHTGRRSNCGCVLTITGSTEWLSETDPAITLGWDWVIDARAGGAKAWRVGLPRTNVSLIDHDGSVMPWELNLETLGRMAEMLLPWQQRVGAMQVQRPQFNSSAPAVQGKIAV
jgi:hypothetical protein